MTKIVGILSWFDESPTWLAATVSSMARICTHVIAVDGRYLHYDDKRVASSYAEHETIMETARGCGVGLSLHIPTKPFENEMQKRTLSFQLASQVAIPHHDWFMVLDGDEVIVDTPDKQYVCGELDKAAEHGVRTVTVTLRDIADPHENLERTRFGCALPIEHIVESRVPRLFRFPEKLECRGYHYNYIGIDENGMPVELWGQDTVTQYRSKWACFTDDIVIEHRHAHRPKVRKKRREQYYQDRDDIGLEKVDKLDNLQEV